MNKKISVVIIGINEEVNILNCVNSIKKTQEYIEKHVEILYVDSGSTDRTIDYLLNHHTDVNIYRIDDHEVKTAAKGRHLGANLSSGEYILFLDADMEIHTCFLKKILNSMYGNEDFSGGIGTREDIFLYQEKEIKRNKNVYGTFESKLCNHFGGALFIKKDALIEAGNYGTCIIANEEAELHSRIIKGKGKIMEYPFEMVKHYIRIEDNKKGWRNLLFGPRNQGIGQGFIHSLYSNSTGHFIKRFKNFFLTLTIDSISLIVLIMFPKEFHALLIVLAAQLFLILFFIYKGNFNFYILNKIYELHFLKGILNYKPNSKINYTVIRTIEDVKGLDNTTTLLR